MNCPRISGLACPDSPCPGASDPHACCFISSLDAWRALGDDEQAGQAANQNAIDPAIRDAVNACIYRGPVLPVSQQPECGCAELSECRAGKGTTPGQVTLRDCLNCQAAQLAG